jgi:cobyrinic acid a,c-diamide synthase
MAHESGSLTAAGPILEEHADLDGIIATARSAPPLDRILGAGSGESAKVRIAIAHDPAFCFYYQDNLDALAAAGAELLFFSPLADRLPEADAVYFGGGYPELHLPELESSACTQELKAAADNDLPVYAECGGLMYLTREIQADTTYRMSGVLPADAEMTKKIQALGYVKGTAIPGPSFLSGNDTILGHEFHYSRILPDTGVRYAMKLSRGKGIDAGNDGLVTGNALGCYTHAYFTKAMVQDFIRAALQYSRQ